MKWVCGLALVVLLWGVAVSNGPNTDLPQRTRSTSGLYVDCPHDNDTASNGDTIYTDTDGLDFDGGDYAPTDRHGTRVTMHGILLTAGTGNVSIKLLGGGEMVVPITVSSGNVVELFRGYAIWEIDSALTTFDGKIFPLF